MAHARPAPPAGNEANVETAARDLYDRLREAVASHLIGDVPIACYLSGGIDSNSVAHMLRDLQFPVYRSYSMVFEGWPQDETDAIDAAIRDHDIPNRKVSIGPDALRRYGQGVWHLEQPQWWTIGLAFHALAEAVRADDLKVTLTGQGSDELLAGYDQFRLAQSMRLLRRFPLSLFRRRLSTNGEAANLAPDLADFIVALEMRPRAQQEQLCGTRPPRHFEWNVLRTIAGEILAPEIASRAADAEARREAWFAKEIRPNIAGLDPLSRGLYVESRVRLPNLILYLEDRMNMAHGVEARPPFLDHTLVEFCAALPADVKLRGGNEKLVLRTAMRGKLHRRQAERKKKAFFAPVRDWLQSSENRDYLDAHLGSGSAAGNSFFREDFLRPAVADLLGGSAAGSPTLRATRCEWLVMLALGYRLLGENMARTADKSTSE